MFRVCSLSTETFWSTLSPASQTGNSPSPHSLSFFGVAYLLCTLVHLDNAAVTHDPRAHQSLLCPSAPTPNSAEGGQREGKAARSDVQIRPSLGYIQFALWGRH